jgi:hypothetical protein
MANDLSASKHRPLPEGLLSPGAELDARTTTTLATTLTRTRLAFDATAGLRVPARQAPPTTSSPSFSSCNLG